MSASPAAGRSVRVVDLDSGQQRPLLPGDAMSFAPRYSPDGSRIVFSMMIGANSDIYVVGRERRPSAAADHRTGHRHRPELLARRQQIVFESDRCGTQQLYVMDADGSEPAPDQLRRRLVCGARVEPRRPMDRLHPPRPGRTADRHHEADGTGEKLLTAGPADEGPSWAASSRELLFQRTDANGPPGALPHVARRQRAAADDHRRRTAPTPTGRG